MKKIFGMMMVLLLVASASAFADDVSVDVSNGNTITNTNTATAGASSDQNQNQRQGQTVVYRGNLPTVGFNGFLQPGTTDGIRWRGVCSEIYKDWTLADIENARDRFSLGDFLTFNWGSNAEFTLVGKPLAANDRPVSCVDYWPRTDARKGDRILGAVDIQGEAGKPDEAYIAQAFGLCKEKTGASRVALLIGEVGDNVTVGASFNLSGALSKISGGGDSGSAVASGIGVGKARVSKEERIIVKALCMNDAPPYVSPSSPPDAKPEPTPVSRAVCDPEPLKRRIAQLEEACSHCKKPCFNNEHLRKQAGDTYVRLYACTGNETYLWEAIKQYQIAERDYLDGREPNGTRTKNLKGAQEVISKTYWNWAACERQLNGRNAEIKFAKSRGMQRMPVSLDELKY